MNDSIGYFSSNRDGGKGQDDIYSFVYVNKYIVVDGIVLLTENTTDPAKDVKVYLLDEKSNILDSTRTNDKGYFAFKNLAPFAVSKFAHFIFLMRMANTR